MVALAEFTGTAEVPFDINTPVTVTWTQESGTGIVVDPNDDTRLVVVDPADYLYLVHAHGVADDLEGSPRSIPFVFLDDADQEVDLRSYDVIWGGGVGSVSMAPRFLALAVDDTLRLVVPNFDRAYNLALTIRAQFASF